MTETESEHGAAWGRMALIAAFGAVAAFGVFGGFSQLGKGGGTSDPADAIPKASFIAATIDFAELRRSPVYDAVFGKEAAGAEPMKKVLGVAALTAACGFDPATRLEKVALSVPEEGDREFGLAARVEVTRDELQKCSGALAAKRGGKTETHDVGTFVVLDDKSIGGVAAPKLAYGKGGLLVVGKGAWFDAMLSAADHRAPGLKDAAEHMTLRTALTSKDGFHTPTVLVTAILPRSLRERLKAQMGSEPGGPEITNTAMAGVLGVSSVGIALNVGPSGKNVDASVELVCDDADACLEVERLVQRKKAEWAKELTLRLVGLGPVLDSIDVKVDGARVRATASAPADALATTIDRILRLRGGRGPGVAPGGGPGRGGAPP